MEEHREGICEQIIIGLFILVLHLGSMVTERFTGIFFKQYPF